LGEEAGSEYRQGPVGNANPPGFELAGDPGLGTRPQRFRQGGGPGAKGAFDGARWIDQIKGDEEEATDPDTSPVSFRALKLFSAKIRRF
jgi:hypothetical protein